LANANMRFPTAMKIPVNPYCDGVKGEPCLVKRYVLIKPIKKPA